MEQVTQLISIEDSGCRIRLVAINVGNNARMFRVIVTDPEGSGYNIARTFSDYFDALQLIDCYRNGN